MQSPEPTPIQPTAGPRRWVILAVLATLAIGGVVTAIVVLSAGKTLTITGSLTLFGRFSSASTCQGSGGYSDITPGAAVVVRDAAGKTVATGRLDAGANFDSFCLFPFTVQNVPPSDFYEIEVSRRGGVTFPREQLESGKGGAALTLGS